MSTLVEEAYALVKLGTTGTEDSGRRAGAIQALRDLNPDLPATNSTVITLPYVWLRRIQRIPFRIPDTTPAGLRAALAALKIHDLYALTAMRAEYVHSLLPGGTATLAEVRRLMDICRLLKVRGMSVDIAIALRDHSPPIMTPQELYEMDQADLLEILEAADPTMPSSLVELRPAYVLQRNARRHAPRPPAGRAPRYVGALRGAEITAEINYWREEANSPQREASERTSAEAISFLLEIQQEMASGAARMVRGDGRGAYPHFRRIWSLLGARARDLGVVSPSSEEVSGPSLETILVTCRELLRRLEPADAELARQRLGAAPERKLEGLQSLRLADLKSTPKGTVRTALEDKPLWALGRGRRRRALTLLTDKTVDQLGAENTAFTQDIQVANAGARVVDLRQRDREVLIENIGAATVLDYATQFSAEWLTLEDELQLHTLAEVVGAALGSPAPFADTVADTAATAFYPSTLLESLRAFDRFYAWRPSRRPEEPPRYVPLNDDFSEQYRNRILPFLRDERRQDVWHFQRADFADPIRFAFLLPALIARPLCDSLARAMSAMGHFELALNFQMGAAQEIADIEGEVPDTSLNNRASAGQTEILEPRVVCGSELVGMLAGKVAEGDQAYRNGHLEKAAEAYEWVLAAAKRCPETASIATYIQPLHEKLVAVAKAGADSGVRVPVNVTDWAVYHSGTGLVSPVLSERSPSKESLADITGRYIERVPGAVTVRYYVRPYEPEGLPVGDHWTNSVADSVFDLNDEGEDPNITDPDFSLPEDNHDSYVPVLDVSEHELLILHAASYLAQLNAGLNWLGLDPDAVPVWRFDYLLSQGRYFAEKADALQQRAMGLLEAADRATLDLKRVQLGLRHAAARADGRFAGVFV